MRHTLTMVVALTLAACGVSESSTQQAAEGDYCNAPFYIDCQPWTTDHCWQDCGYLAYCPEFTPTEIQHCRTHPGPGFCGDPVFPLNCDSFGNPCYIHHCKSGAAALTSEGGEP